MCNDYNYDLYAISRRVDFIRTLTFISHHSLIISWCCDISSSLICVLFLLTWSYFPNPHMHEEWLYERIWHDMIYYDITCSVMIWYHLSHFYRYRFLDRTLKEFDWRHIFFWIHLKSIQKMLNLIISDHLISNVPYLAICKIYLFSSLLFSSFLFLSGNSLLTLFYKFCRQLS